MREEILLQKFVAELDSRRKEILELHVYIYWHYSYNQWWILRVKFCLCFRLSPKWDESLECSHCVQEHFLVQQGCAGCSPICCDVMWCINALSGAWAEGCAQCHSCQLCTELSFLVGISLSRAWSWKQGHGVVLLPVALCEEFIFERQQRGWTLILCDAQSSLWKNKWKNPKIALQSLEAFS